MAKPETIDEYLAELSEDKRAALEKVRQTIRTVVPSAEEYFYYHIPAFRLNGQRLIGFAAATNHCSIYPLSGATVKAFKEELKNYDTSPGTIRFQTDKPLPVALVRKLVKARLEENEEQLLKRAAARRKKK